MICKIIRHRYSSISFSELVKILERDIVWIDQANGYGDIVALAIKNQTIVVHG